MYNLLIAVPFFIIIFAFYTFLLPVDSKEKSSSFQIAELQNIKDAPVELGQVDWVRNFDEASAKAKDQNKPLLVLFQEVPGCSTSSGYGKNVLSHPQIVEAIETLFVPVAVYNNHGGEDERVLKSFGEPSWNNPVVRIITPDRKELVSRLNGDYTKAGLVRAMITALKNDNKPVPKYLSLLAQDLNVNNGEFERATFAMHCFWVGEAKLGNINGVISTIPGFMGGHEVVELEYNPDIVSYGDLVKKAKAHNLARHVFTENAEQSSVAKSILGESNVSPKSAFRADGSPKYYMSRTLYKYVPLTKTQMARVNAALGRSQSPNMFLSPRQLEIYNYIQDHQDLNWPNLVTSSDFTNNWHQTVSLLNTQISQR